MSKELIILQGSDGYVTCVDDRNELGKVRMTLNAPIKAYYWVMGANWNETGGWQLVEVRDL